MDRQVAHVGTYTDEAGEGISTFEVTVRDETLDVSHRDLTHVDDNPSFLTVDPSGSYLYAVNEVDPGGVTSFRLSDDGGLTRLGRVPSGARGPCHCRVHPSESVLFVAHYTGAAVSVLPIGADGQADEPTATVPHDGSSVDSERQSQAHPHATVPSPDGEYVYVPDLGTDEVVVYRFQDGTLSLADAVPIQDGAGPRHLAFHPHEEIVYVINELDSTVTVFDRDPATGTLRSKQTVSTLPDDFAAHNQASALLVHPTGRWVYGSNRGHDSVVVFAVDEEDGTLTTVGHEASGGRWPRHVALDRSDRFLFVENMHSDEIVVFRLDTETGLPVPTGTAIDTPSPSCLQFVGGEAR